MLFWPVIVFALLVIIGMTLFLLTCTYHLLILRCPFVPTSRRTAREMVRFARLKGTERVYDLGAGDGAVLIEAKRAHPGVTAIGIERVITVVWLGWLRIKLSRQSVDLRLGDAFDTNVSDAGAVFLYLAPHLMEKLEKKFDRELKPGTVVVSNTFRFPGREATEEKSLETGPHLFRYVWS